MTETLAAELRALADANRHVPVKHRLNREALAAYLVAEGRRICERLGLALTEMELDYLARQYAWLAVPPNVETSRLTARRRHRRNLEKGEMAGRTGFNGPLLPPNRATS